MCVHHPHQHFSLNILEIVHLHDDYNPGFHGQAPEPIHKNLIEFSNLIKTRGDIDCGLCTDGDADRIGLYDSKGNFVDSHHIILLLVKYLVEHKKFDGKVITAVSVTPRIKKLCQHFGLENRGSGGPSGNWKSPPCPVPSTPSPSTSAPPAAA